VRLTKRALVLLAMTAIAVVGAAAPASAGDDGGDGHVGGGTIGVGVGTGTPGGGGPGGGPVGPTLIGTWSDSFIGLCTSTGGIIVLLPLPIIPIPIIPIPIGDVSGQIQGFVIEHQLISPDGAVLIDYVENQCDPASPPPPAPPPTFQQVFDLAKLPVPSVVTSPKADGLVGLQNWFWWQDANGGHAASKGVSVTTPDGRWTATGTAQLTRVTWDLGNGDRVSAGGGALPGSEASPAAHYTYQHDGTYTITETALWTATFTLTDNALGLTTTTGQGATQTIGTRNYTVHEVQAVDHG
jgi:hypothetical protein